MYVDHIQMCVHELVLVYMLRALNAFECACMCQFKHALLL